MKGFGQLLCIVCAVAALILCCPVQAPASDGNQGMQWAAEAVMGAVEMPGFCSVGTKVVPDPGSKPEAVCAVAITEKMRLKEGYRWYRLKARQGVRLNCPGGTCWFK